MDFEADVPCYVVTYKELLERKRKSIEKLPTLRSSNTDSCTVVETDEKHVCSGVHNLSASSSSPRETESSRRGVFQLKPTHHENRQQKSKLQVDEHHREYSSSSRGRRSRENPVRGINAGSNNTVATAVHHKWNTKEGELQNLLSRWTGSSASVARIFSSCESLEAVCVQFLSTDVVEFSSKDIVSKMWKSVHYPVTDSLRRNLRRCQADRKDAMLSEATTFLTHSVDFYLNLLERIQEMNKFQLTRLLDGTLGYTSRDHRKKVKLALHSCHTCYICLGDLSRYKEELQPSTDWACVRSYYLKAQQLVPKNGKPYNQLAVVALNAHRRLDAVYYYVRSLKAKNQFLSAYDSLMGLFDETTRKANEEEKSQKKEEKRQETRKRKEKRSMKQLREQRRETTGDDKGRKEVWLLPGAAEDESASSSKPDFKPMQEKAVSSSSRINQMDEAELSRNLTQAFLVAHGKLFTKIGVESFEVALNKFILLLDTYLKRHVLNLNDASKFIKMTSINIFLFHHVNETIDDPNSCSVYLGLASLLALRFLTSVLLMCEQIVETYCQQHEQLATDGGEALCTEMQQLLIRLGMLLPAVKIWMDWSTTHAALWTNSISTSSLALVLEKFWCTLASCLNLFQECLPLKLAPSSFGSRLWEDKMLAGYTVLPSCLTFDELCGICDHHQLSDKDCSIQCLSRVLVVNQYAQKLCLAEEVCIKCDPHTNVFSVMKTTLTSVLTHHDDASASAPPTEGLDESWSTESPSDQDDDGSGDSDTGQVEVGEELDVAVSKIQQLKLEKERLTSEVKQQQQHEQSAQDVIEEASKGKGTLVMVKPRYLVPDTNCFIDMLACLQRLVSTRQFVIAVPLTVIAELEGLSKGAIVNEGESEDDKRKSAHAQEVSEKAKQAVEYVTQQIVTLGSSQLKVLTSQGSLLSSLTFRAEITDKGKNDDLILQSSISLHSRVDQRQTKPRPLASDEVHSVVLLTDDRNLRVKAHAGHLPVKDVTSFMSLLEKTNLHDLCL